MTLSLAGLRLTWRCYLIRRREALVVWVAWHLPREVVMRAYVRVGAHATTGQFGNTVVPELGMMEALKRWDIPDPPARS